MPKNKKKNKQDPTTEENQDAEGAADGKITSQFRLEVDNVIKSLLNTSTGDSYAFDPSLTKVQRKYIHKVCQSRGFKTKSQGSKPLRFIEIFVHEKKFKKHINCALKYSREISKLMDYAILTNATVFNAETETLTVGHASPSVRIFSRLNSKCLSLVPKVLPNRLTRFKEVLPIHDKKSQFLQLLNSNQVIFISSETGSGKSTQIPQFILEQAHARNEYCKIICTQPRRISTTSVAERVAFERGERIGDTVGYHIKLESKSGPNSALIYCTNGILLQIFMNKDACFFENVTHIILDEIHERVAISDMLLISLRECLQNNPQLKLILMSATCEVELFMSYFSDAQLLHVDGRRYNVRDYYLDDILNLLGEVQVTESVSLPPTEQYSVENNDYDKAEMDAMIKSCVDTKEEEYCTLILQSILSEGADINHKASEGGYTPLMAAAIAGNMELADTLLKMGADVSLKSTTEKTASMFAWENSNEEIHNLIMVYAEPVQKYETYVIRTHCQILDVNMSMKIDFNLIIELITHIQTFDHESTVLIFLPGYEDIIVCAKQLSSSSIDRNKIEIICLHSSISVSVRKRIFQTFYRKQKIILSTNIAETGITIPDVVYVIDTGLAKEISYDSIGNISILQKTSISKASAIQRSGRAGRTRDGICFRLYTKACYDSFIPHRIPEILRVPLDELCLQSKLLSKREGISDFLNMAVERPPQKSIDRAISGLIAMNALDKDEELTILGKQVLQLSLEPRLGKMLIYSVILQCLDPVLTIVSSLTQEPFCLPFDPAERRIATEKQKELSGRTLSDHFGLMKAFALWEASANSRGGSTSEIKEYYINANAMRLIQATRSVLLSRLKAIGYNRNQDLNRNSTNWAVVKSAIAAGCYPNLAYMTDKSFNTRTEKKIGVAAASVLNDVKPGHYVVYESLSQMEQRKVIRCGTAVSPLTVALFCSKIENTQRNNSIILDDWLEMNHRYPNLFELRTMLDIILNKKISQPEEPFNTSENDFLKYLAEILEIQDASLKLKSPFNAQRSTFSSEEDLSTMVNIEEFNAADFTCAMSEPSTNEVIGNADLTHLNSEQCTHCKSVKKSKKAKKKEKNMWGPLDNQITTECPYCKTNKGGKKAKKLKKLAESALHNVPLEAFGPDLPTGTNKVESTKTIQAEIVFSHDKATNQSNAFEMLGKHSFEDNVSRRKSTTSHQEPFTVNGNTEIIQAGTIFSNGKTTNSNETKIFVEKALNGINETCGIPIGVNENRHASPSLSTNEPFDLMHNVSIALDATKSTDIIQADVIFQHIKRTKNYSEFWRSNSASTLDVKEVTHIAAVGTNNLNSTVISKGRSKPFKIGNSNTIAANSIVLSKNKKKKKTKKLNKSIASSFINLNINEFSDNSNMGKAQACLNLPKRSDNVPDSASKAQPNIHSASKLLAAIHTHNDISPSHLLLNGINSTNKNNTVANNVMCNSMFEISDISVFFVIKPLNEEHFKTGVTSKIWRFSQHVDKKLFKFLNLDYCVYLFFTIPNTRQFQGFAKLRFSTSVDLDRSIEWLSMKCVSYDAVDAMGISNLCNNSLLIYDGRDGQEIDYFAGLKLAQMFYCNDL